MGKLGWSYPPGCTGTPYDEEYPCGLCGEEDGMCCCPECGVCGEQGAESCYDDEGHGLWETEQQRQYAARIQEEGAALAAYEAKLYETYLEDDYLKEPRQRWRDRTWLSSGGGN